MSTEQTKQTSYFIFKDAIVVNTGDKSFTIAKSDPRYSEVLMNCLSNQLDKLSNLSEVTDQRKLNKLLGLGE